MNKEQELLAISRLVFELTLASQRNVDLDTLLAHLHKLLIAFPGIEVMPHSAIFLLSARNSLIQVAQLGLHDTHYLDSTQTLRAIRQGDDALARLSTVAEQSTEMLIEWPDPSQSLMVLPLIDGERVIGRILLFTDQHWQPDPVEFEFMTDVARAMSVIVSRHIVSETLTVREIELQDARAHAISRLGAASEYRDNETGLHVMRMTHYAVAIAKAMGLSEQEREIIGICAPMHDVGKIGIPDAILLKPGRLDADEYTIMQRHTHIGSQLLKGRDELIRAAAEIAEFHHERWDGQGYPNGLRGESIPLFARICSVADVFDALTSARPYKEPWSLQRATEWIHEQSAIYFDPAVVRAFDLAYPELLRIRELYSDEIIDPQRILNLPELPAVPAGEDWVLWQDDLSVGIDTIDEHHRYLFELTNQLYRAIVNKTGVRTVARVLKSLEHYAQVHFRAEERMMEHHGYARLDEQLHQHHRFEVMLREFYTELHDTPMTAPYDVLIYLRDWLIGHIKHEDAGLGSLVNRPA